MADTASPTRTIRKRERTRGELVAAAETLVAARGIDAISIDDIVEAADVAKGTFYTHFADKDDLAAAIALRGRMELEAAITTLNRGVTDAGERMANGLSTSLAFAIANPIRARALLRLQPRAVDPAEQMNAGLRGDILLGVKTKRFWAASIDAAFATVIGGTLSAILRISDTNHRVADPHAFATDVVTTLLVALGLKQAEAKRLASAAVTARRKEAKS
ncbi:MAG: TetR/AcrR family transcriptional regulator [Alphaproteobacteria bacterium]|nr:TetR/AcrR family transcriptional regulator [Alphaproteobacteria bacterium]